MSFRLEDKYLILLIFFDLPTKTKYEKRIARKFRNHLLKDGFFMIQFSVYARISKNYALLEKHINRINKYLPNTGSVKTLIINKEQYNSMKELINIEEYNFEKDYRNSNQIVYL